MTLEAERSGVELSRVLMTESGGEWGGPESVVMTGSLASGSGS